MFLGNAAAQRRSHFRIVNPRVIPQSAPVQLSGMSRANLRSEIYSPALKSDVVVARAAIAEDFDISKGHTQRGNKSGPGLQATLIRRGGRYSQVLQPRPVNSLMGSHSVAPLILP